MALSEGKFGTPIGSAKCSTMLRLHSPFLCVQIRRPLVPKKPQQRHYQTGMLRFKPCLDRNVLNVVQEAKVALSICNCIKWKQSAKQESRIHCHYWVCGSPASAIQFYSE
eukprot:Gb_20803 [translate_table: standard]